jgi:hypothetical protein
VFANCLYNNNTFVDCRFVKCTTENKREDMQP